MKGNKAQLADILSSVCTFKLFHWDCLLNVLIKIVCLFLIDLQLYGGSWDQTLLLNFPP